MSNVRKMGDTAVEDRSGQKTLVGYNESNDQIKNIAVSDRGAFGVAIFDFFPDIRFDYDGDNNCIYRGSHTTLGESTSSTDWQITKFDYDSDNNVTRKRYRVTSWTGRTSGW